jgi:acetyl esterase
MPSHHAVRQRLPARRGHIDWFFDQVHAIRQRNDWRFAPLNADESARTWRGPGLRGPGRVRPGVRRGLAYADRLRGAHVPVDLEIYRGVVHGFINLGRAIPEALKAHADAARALRHAFAGHGAS